MPLTSTGLSSEFVSVNSNPASVSEAIDNWATAFTDYFYNATVLGTAINPGTLSAARSAMVSSLSTPTADGRPFLQADFPNALQTGIIAFWGVVASSAATLWTLTPPISAATPPPSLSGIGAAILTAGQSNSASGNNKSQAADAFAAALHPLMLGGTATQPGTPPIVSPIL